MQHLPVVPCASAEQAVEVITYNLGSVSGFIVLQNMEII